MNRAVALVALFFSLSLMLHSWVSAAGDRYKVTDLGALDAKELHPTAINNVGQVAGFVVDGNGHRHAFISNRSTRKIEEVQGFGGNESWVLGINDYGRIVGGYTIFGNQHAFISDRGSFTDLFTTAGLVEATDINNKDVITGTLPVSESGSFEIRHSVTYDKGMITDLTELALKTGNMYGRNNSFPSAINDAGDAIVFQGVCASYECDHSYLFSANAFVAHIFPFHATDINDAGTITGFGLTPNSTDFEFHLDGYIIANGKKTTIPDLGGLVTMPSGINNRGEIVGKGQDANGVFHPFIYSKGMITDLNDLISSPICTVTDITDINDRGQIAGTGRISGENRVILLTPLKSPK